VIDVSLSKAATDSHPGQTIIHLLYNVCLTAVTAGEAMFMVDCACNFVSYIIGNGYSCHQLSEQTDSGSCH